MSAHDDQIAPVSVKLLAFSHLHIKMKINCRFCNQPETQLSHSNYLPHFYDSQRIKETHGRISKADITQKKEKEILSK